MLVKSSYRLRAIAISRAKCTNHFGIIAMRMKFVRTETERLRMRTSSAWFGATLTFTLTLCSLRCGSTTPRGFFPR